MTIGFVFWLIWIIWVLFGYIGLPAGDNRYTYGRHTVMVVLTFLLGWHDFGFPIHG